ncbi:syntaxin binding protein 2 [Salpingoeca rosetta]|uniref:Syntaxin binding protein 2 n=1 Tax=Salpingoeca rosetta (strain ATCC 50818 / BSB-021) TaxID=946362 RepID=F2UC73_SALR5|nr:syntaxin binding protein 2 [Salpingoeca rosetta]EGD74180.1 syntaxin binding protein 2 [Salpingoeca rosetta]|eukprot:XP_004993080.1 syntaxin binding protein 2 [Salpingoeca rosetta]
MSLSLGGPSREELEQFSLKAIVQAKIRDEVLHGIKVEEGDLWKVLVVDDTALHILSSCYRMSEVIQEGITVVEGINKSRKEIPDFHALYLCLPTEENVQRIVDDITPRPLYKAVHIFFLTPCPQPLLAKLARPRVVKHVKTLKEVNILFKPIEARVFTLDRPDGLYSCYSPHAPAFDIDGIAAQVLTLCETLKERPVVRCPRASSSSFVLILPIAAVCCGVLRCAAVCCTALDLAFGPGLEACAQLRFGAACFDLLDIKNGMYSFEFRDGAGRASRKQVRLDESDDLWVAFRHRHISEVFREVTEKFKAFSDEAKRTQGLPKGEASESTKALKDLLKALPQHREKTQMFSVHIDMSTKINKAFSSAVEECTRAEQNILCREEPDGTPVKDVINEISSVLIDRSLSIEDRLRCAMMCVLAKGGTSKRELDTLLDNANIPEPRRAAVTNLHQLGAVVTTDKKSKRTKPPKRKQRSGLYDMSRWTPMLKDVIEDLCDGTLPTSEYTAIRSPDSVVSKGRRKQHDDDDDDDDDNVQSSRGQWAQGKNTKRGQRKVTASKTGGAHTDRPRLIIVVLGSISYSEMRCVYEVADAAGWDIYIGSHGILSPSEFVEAIEQLDKPRAASEPAVVRPAQEDEEGSLTFVQGSSTAVASV